MFYLDHIEVSIKFLLHYFSGGPSRRMKVPLGQVRPFIMQNNQMFSFKLFFLFSCPNFIMSWTFYQKYHLDRLGTKGSSS